jgi:hypothetical protein
LEKIYIRIVREMATFKSWDESDSNAAWNLVASVPPDIPASQFRSGWEEGLKGLWRLTIMRAADKKSLLPTVSLPEPQQTSQVLACQDLGVFCKNLYCLECK